MSQTNDTEAFVEYWESLGETIRKLEKLDDAGLVFGARTRGGGHDYRILPKVTDREILEFETRNGLILPYEYRSFLQLFGAGGAGPEYGIYDFRKAVMPQIIVGRFPHAEEVWYDDLPDDDPIYKYPGLAGICTAGCGTEFMLEMNGASPGQVWCDWTEACTPQGTFLEFYKAWVDRVEQGLERYHLLKAFIDEATGRLKPKGLMLADVVDRLQCDFNRRGREWSSSVPEGEKWVYFERTPGRVTVNDKDEVLKIEVSSSNSIN